jgi:hypothetical protein
MSRENSHPKSVAVSDGLHIQGGIHLTELEATAQMDSNDFTFHLASFVSYFMNIPSGFSFLLTILNREFIVN